MIETSKTVYEDFLVHIVRGGVFSTGQRERGSGRTLGEKTKRLVAKGDKLDDRAPLLATLSGKGGWIPGPKFERRKPFTNVTLIDHLASVVRGALVFAEIDLRAAGVSQRALQGRLAKIGAVAFLHDADKLLQRNRLIEVTPNEVGRLMSEYRVVQFLAKSGQEVDAERMVSMIDQVEVNRANRFRPGGPVLSFEEIQDCAYVSLADRLDGTFLDTRKGIEGVVAELEKFENLRGDCLRSWSALRVVSPHTPFLLDSLQTGFSNACFDLHGHPPLIEVHHDGELLLVAPSERFDDMFDGAIEGLATAFNMGPRVNISARGMPEILDGGCDIHDIHGHLAENIALASKVLQISIDLVRPRTTAAPTLKREIDDLFDRLGAAPRWPDLDKYSRRLVSPWTGDYSEDDARDAFIANAATISVALGSKEPKPSQKLNVPDAHVRESELRSLLEREGIAIPGWLGELHHGISRRSLLSALASAALIESSTLRDSLLGGGGLVDLWLCGRGDRQGLLDKIENPGLRMVKAAETWFKSAARRSLVRADEQDAEGRCHFTNTPVSRAARIDASTGLYGLKVSAFSGREGRPEFLDKARSETLVSPLALAEHRLRSMLGGRSRGAAEGPIIISSPTSAGLFASLPFEHNDLPTEFSLFDAIRFDTRKADKLVFSDVENFSRRYRIGRYESLPNRMSSSDREIGMITFVRMVFETARRIGRPLHVFRGLPRPDPGFVSFDFLPEHLAAALGDTSFRIEQIPSKIGLLGMIDEAASTTGLGPELAARIADPATRFAASCDAVVRIGRMEKAKAEAKGFLRHSLLNLLEDRETMKTETDNVIVQFAEVMARVQRAPIRSDGDTVSEMGLRTALDAVEAAAQLGQTSRESLIHAVMGSLKKELRRKELFSRKATREDATVDSAILGVAESFVDDVWPNAFGATSPASRKRRIALAIYRMSFESAARAMRDITGQPSESDSPESE